MKTVRKGEAIKRVRDVEAVQLVKQWWEYCAKRFFKALRTPEQKEEKK